MSVVRLWPEARRREGAVVVVSTTVEWPNGSRQTLWYRVPEQYAELLAENSDPFVVGVIYPLMEAGCDVVAHGAVSPSLLRNLQEYQAAWSEWIPGLAHVDIRADQEVEGPYKGDRGDSIVAFSGGVDSCFTAYRHARAAAREVPGPLSAGVMVHGFDIPLEEPETFAVAAERSERLLASLGLDLISVATNYRSLVRDWSHSFGAAVASCLMLFAGRFSRGLIGQGFTYGEYHLLREGSNPLTDPLLSSDTFRVVPDGSAFGRSEKIAAMKEWAELYRHLRVCWEGPRKDRNCCRCEKCIRNILSFRVLGLGLPSCFSEDVEDSQLKTMRLGRGALPEIRYGSLLRLAKELGVEGTWVKVLGKRLAKDQRDQASRLRYHLRRLPYYRDRIWSRLSGES